MALWRYEDDRLSGQRFTPSALGAFYLEARHATDCAFCGTHLELLGEVTPTDAALIRDYRSAITAPLDGPAGSSSWHAREQRRRRAIDPQPGLRAGVQHRSRLFEERLRACPMCGWWIAFRETVSRIDSEVIVDTYGGVGALKLLDLTDVSTPVGEVRAYLTGRYEERFQVDPTLFEQTVASVFGDLGYVTRVTGRTGDDGIDVILDGPDGTTIGVQVKRYRGKISVAQIRELTGALFNEGFTRGIFVTTSDFQSGATRTAGRAAFRGIPIELYDAERFYDALELAQRARWKSDDVARLLHGSLRQIFRQSSDGEAPTF